MYFLLIFSYIYLFFFFFLHFLNQIFLLLHFSLGFYSLLPLWLLLLRFLGASWPKASAHRQRWRSEGYTEAHRSTTEEAKIQGEDTQALWLLSLLQFFSFGLLLRLAKRRAEPKKETKERSWRKKPMWRRSGLFLCSLQQSRSITSTSSVSFASLVCLCDRRSAEPKQKRSGSFLCSFFFALSLMRSGWEEEIV